MLIMVIGKKIKNSYGYIWIRNPNHPRSHQNGYVFEHILVMEKHLGRAILRTECVHHKNGDKADNRIENLELTTRKFHVSMHKKKDMSGRKCLECGSDKTRGHSRDGRPSWLKRGDGFICHKCYSRINWHKYRKSEMERFERDTTTRKTRHWIGLGQTYAECNRGFNGQRCQ